MILARRRGSGSGIGGPEHLVQVGRAQPKSFRLGQGQELESGAVRPAAPPPVADGAVRHADGFCHRDHSAELLDQVHAWSDDTKCVMAQAGFEACLDGGPWQAVAMAGAGRDSFDVAAGLRLARVRVALGLKQEALAEKLGISRSRIANFEQGTRTPDPRVMSRLSELYGVTTDYIYHGDARMMPSWIMDGIAMQPAERPQADRGPETQPRHRAAGTGRRAG